MGIIEEKKTELGLSCQLEIIGDLEPLESVQVAADPIELGRIISNLMNNAFNAQKESSSIRTPYITVRATLSGAEFVVITISDRGSGLDENSIQWFNLGVFRGGCGLPHARKCLDDWGGTLAFSKNSAGGTVVELQLRISYSTSPEVNADFLSSRNYPPSCDL
jgi:C4-dicarboxylate-specific signal transduction histidine kinase